MSNRITEKDLQLQCEELNNLFGYALECYTKAPEDPNALSSGYRPNPNVFHLNHAYGGVSLQQMSSTPGCTGVSDVHGVYGRYTKRELYNLMRAYVHGIYDAREAAK